MGNQYGGFRLYPSATAPRVDGQCEAYDPRIRPWYVSATTGPKNLIMVLDISGTMQFKLGRVKEAANKIITSLGTVDFVGIVAFNESAYPDSNRIERATSEKKEDLFEFISNLKANGNTNFENAFTTAISMLKSATADEYGSPCSNSESVILFLTDGRAEDGLTSDALISKIN